MPEGKVVFFNQTKGLGLITPANGGENIFVNASGLVQEIKEGDNVTYEVENGKKSPTAVNVQHL